MSNQGQGFGIQTIAYEQLQAEFQDVLASLSSDQTLDRFRVEYEKIHRALRHSRQQDKKLLGKCRQLSKQIVASSSQLQAAVRFSNDDSHKISFLKAQVTKAYKYLQNSREQQQILKQKIQKQKVQVRNLHMLMQQNDSIKEGQVASVHEYTIANEELLKEKQILQVSLESNKTEFAEIKLKIEESEAKKEELKKEYERCLKKKQMQELKVKQEQQNKKMKKDELEVIKVHFDKAKNDEGISKERRKELNMKFKDLTNQLYELEILIDKEKKYLKKLDKEQAIQHKKIEEVEEINTNLKSLMELKEKQLAGYQTSVSKQQEKHENLTKVNDSIKEEIEQVLSQRQQVQKLIETINSGILQLENQINTEKKNSTKDKSFIQKLKRDRDMYIKELQRSEVNNKKLYEEVIAKQKVLKQKQNETSGQKKEIEKFHKIVIAVEKERDSNSFQANSAEAKYFYSREEVKLRDNFIAEFQKQNIETEAKLKKQQSLYQAVRSDRNLVSKKLAQIQQQKKQYLNRYRRVNHQINQLKEQIDAKQADLVKQHNEHNKKDKKIEDEDKKIKKFEKDIEEKDEKIKNFFVQKNKLEAIIKEIEYQKQKLQEEYELVVSQRDILGTQLIRRSAEAELLYEKIKISQSFLNKGENQYREKIIDIEAQKEEIAMLMNEIKAFKSQNSSIGDLKDEIHSLTRELTESKLKVKALSEEIENPMNVHRWRKLQATDSVAYEIMTKIQSIQKRLISKTEEVKAKQEKLASKQKELKALQQVIKRQPSIEQQKMIPIYEQSLVQKEKQIESMKQQIQNYEQTMHEYTIELTRLQKQLQNFKLKFFTQKKRQQQSKDDKKGQQDYIKVILPDKRFTGGGFNLAI